MQERCRIKDIFIWYNCRQLSIPSEILRKTFIIVEVIGIYIYTHVFFKDTIIGHLLVSVQRVKEDRSCGDVSFKNNISQDTYIEI
jgi:Mn2+/Fe2+ NRAMP family transporter